MKTQGRRKSSNVEDARKRKNDAYQSGAIGQRATARAVSKYEQEMSNPNPTPLGAQAGFHKMERAAKRPVIKSMKGKR